MDRLKGKQSLLIKPDLENKFLNSDLLDVETPILTNKQENQKINIAHPTAEDAKLLVKKINEERREREKRKLD